LVLQTVLPALMLAGGDSVVSVEGGTHNSKAPPFAFLSQAFLPLIRKMGPQVSLELVRPGFYPAGGGRIEVSIQPATSLSPLSILEVGARQPLRAQALVSALPRGVGHREILTLRDHIDLEWSDTDIILIEQPRGPGNALHVFAPCETVTEVFTGFGERKKRAEEVAEEVAKEVLAYLEMDVPVGEHLADQLLLPMALAGGGRFRATPLSLHTTTNIEVIQTFLDVPFAVHPLKEEGGPVEVVVG
ncbi:MAG: RNA 3'-terminal phosphate cyclase, partial [Myxococcota bacterium]